MNAWNSAFETDNFIILKTPFALKYQILDLNESFIFDMYEIFYEIGVIE